MYTQIQEIGGKGGPVNLKGNPDGTLVIGYQRPLFDLRAKASAGVDPTRKQIVSVSSHRAIALQATAGIPISINAYPTSDSNQAVRGGVFVSYNASPTKISDKLIFDGKTYTVSRTVKSGASNAYQVEGFTFADFPAVDAYAEVNVQYADGAYLFDKTADAIYDDNDGRIAWTIKEDTLLIPKIGGTDLPVRHSMSGKVIVTAIYASEAVGASHHAPWGIVSGNQETSVRARWPGEEPIEFHIRSNAGCFWVGGAEMIEIANTPVSSILCLGFKRS